MGWRGGSTRAHRTAREYVLRRDGFRCRLAYPGTWVVRGGAVRSCLGEANEAHHTRGKQITGDDPRFMIAACQPCNLRAGDPTRVTTPDPPGRSATQW
jgi:hypothetical protein